MRSLDRATSGISWLWALSLVVAPLLYVFVMSFLTRGSYGGVVYEFQLGNYARFLDGDTALLLGTVFLRSLGLALLNTFLCALIGYPMALFLVFRAGKWRGLLFFLLILPFWTNFLIRTYAWFAILSDNGWLNSVLESFGFGPQAVALLFTPSAVLIGMLYNYLPYMAMSLYVSIEKIDIKLVEAAADLGASPWRRFRKVILPLSVPGLIAGSVMVFIPSLGEFVIPDILGGGTSLYMGNLLAQQFLVVRNWPFGAALSVAFVALVITCFRILEKSAGERVRDEMMS